MAHVNYRIFSPRVLLCKESHARILQQGPRIPSSSEERGGAAAANMYIQARQDRQRSISSQHTKRSRAAVMGPGEDEDDHEGSRKNGIVDENGDGMREKGADGKAAAAGGVDGLDVWLGALAAGGGAEERDRGGDRDGLGHQANSRHGLVRQDAVGDAQGKGRNEGRDSDDAQRTDSRGDGWR